MLANMLYLVLMFHKEADWHVQDCAEHGFLNTLLGHGLLLPHTGACTQLKGLVQIS